MNFSNIKKQFNKTNQLLGEKVGNIKGTTLESDYVLKEKKIDMYKDLFDSLLSKTTEYLQPNPTYRAKLMTVNVLHKIQKQNSQKALYPQIEGQLADIFRKHAAEIPGTSFGDTLTDCGDSFKELEEIKYALEDHLKQNYIEPIMQMRNNDLKEISTHRKKVQSRRLTYDALKRNKEKGSKVSEEELKEAESKFEEAKEIASSAMDNFLDREMEHMSLIAEFVKAEKDYHQQADQIMDRLHQKIMNLRDSGGSKRNSNRVTSWNNSDTKSPTSGDRFSYNPPTFKKSHDSNNATPTCRALFNFEAETDAELAFKEGEVIKLIQQVDENWFEGELRGEIGVFPVNFVEVLIPLRD